MFQRLWQLWRKFWFAPVSPLPICAYRILVGLLILQITVVHTLPAALFWYGPNGIIPIDDVIKYFWKSEPRLDALLLFPATDAAVQLFLCIFILVTVCFTVGLCTRQSAILVAIGIVSLHHHQPFNTNGGDTFLRIAMIILCFSDCGKYLSLDRVIKKWRGVSLDNTPSNPWAQRLLQVQFALVYWQTFCCKIVGPQWLDGTAVYYATRLDDMLKFDLPFLNNLVFCKLLTWYTLLIEFCLWTVIWVKRARYYVLIGALILHLGIDLSINLPVFEWAFIFTLILFVEPQDLQQHIEGVKATFQKRANGVE